MFARSFGRVFLTDGLAFFIYHKVVEAGKEDDRSRDELGRFKPTVYNVNDGTSTKGNSKAYGLSRLQKHRKDLYQSVLDKEMSRRKQKNCACFLFLFKKALL